MPATFPPDRGKPGPRVSDAAPVARRVTLRPSETASCLSSTWSPRTSTVSPSRAASRAEGRSGKAMRSPSRTMEAPAPADAGSGEAAGDASGARSAGEDGSSAPSAAPSARAPSPASAGCAASGSGEVGSASPVPASAGCAASGAAACAPAGTRLEHSRALRTMGATAFRGMVLLSHLAPDRRGRPRGRGRGLGGCLGARRIYPYAHASRPYSDGIAIPPLFLLNRRCAEALETLWNPASLGYIYLRE